MPAFQLSPKYKRNIYRILPFGFFWAAFGIIYSLMEKGLLGNLDHYPSTGNANEFSGSIIMTPIGSAIMGWLLGAAEILFLSKYFSQRSFGAKIIIKTFLYLIALWQCNHWRNWRR
jgi:adenylate cyclase